MADGAGALVPAEEFPGMAAYLESLPASATEAAALNEPAAIPVTVLSAANSTPEQMEEREAWRAAPRAAGTSSRGRAGIGFNSTNRS